MYRSTLRFYFFPFFVEVYKDAALFSCLLKFDLQVTVRYFLWSALFSTDKYVLFTFVRSYTYIDTLCF